MKVKNVEIINFANSTLANKKLPTKLSFAIAVNSEEAAKKIKVYDEERKKLAEQMAKKDEEGKPVIEDNYYIFEDPDAWSNTIQELLDTEVEVAMTTVTLDEVAKCDEPEFDALTIPELSVIKFMIEK